MNYEERRYMKDVFSLNELKELIQRVPLGEILNKKGIVYKARRDELEGLTEEQLLEEMAKEPKLIRRPLVIMDNKVIAGYDEAAYQQTFRK